MTSKSNEHIPCFAGDAHNVIEDFRCRFCGEKSDAEAVLVFNKLINDAAGEWTTRLYDSYQESFIGL